MFVECPWVHCPPRLAIHLYLTSECTQRFSMDPQKANTARKGTMPDGITYWGTFQSSGSKSKKRVDENLPSEDLINFIETLRSGSHQNCIYTRICPQLTCFAGEVPVEYSRGLVRTIALLSNFVLEREWSAKLACHSHCRSWESSDWGHNSKSHTRLRQDNFQRLYWCFKFFCL